MEELKKLFDVLSEEGLYTKSFEEFTTQYQDEEYQDRVFDAVSTRGLYTKNIDSFKTKYSKQDIQPGVSVGLALEEEEIEDSGGFVNFIGDLYRAGIGGYEAASTSGESLDMWKQGSNVSKDSVQEFIRAKQAEAEDYKPSERMKRFSTQYEKEGKTWAAFFRGIKKDPGLMAEMFVQSIGTQLGTLADSPEARKWTASATAGGAAAGSFIPGIGTAVGGVTATLGGAATAMETALTFGELIEAELQKEGKEFTDDNILELLQSPKGQEIRNKSIGRGLTIGAIETLSGGLAGKATTGVLKTANIAGRTKKITAVAAGLGVEATGGGIGEVAGRVVAGQEMDPAEIGFEAITGTTTAPINVGMALLGKKPVYKINGEKVSYAKMKDFVDTADDMDIAMANLEIENDQTGLDKKAHGKQNKAIIDSQIDEKITDKDDRKTLVKLEQERQLKQIEAEKKGIDKVPNAAEELAVLEAEIEGIIGKYEGAVDVGETAIAKEVAKARRDISISKTIAFAEAAGKKIGKDVLIAENDLSAQATYDKIAKEMGLDAKDVTGSDGFIVGDSIIINKDIAGKTGQINVGAHEVLHGVIAKHMQSLDVKGQTKLISSFKNTLTEDQRNYVETEINRRIKTGEDLNINTTEEWLTVFSDGLTKGDITFNEGVFDKLKNFVQEIARKFGIKKEFADGRQVYNFMKDYQKSIEKNQLSARAIALAGEGVAVTDMKLSKTSPRAQQFLDAEIDNESLVDIEQSPQSTPEDRFGAAEAIIEKLSLIHI